MTADAKLIPSIPEGSILVLTGFSFRRPWTDGDDLDDPIDDDTADRLWGDMRRAIIDVVGHERFLLLHLPDDGADVEVWGPDTDLEAKVSELLKARGMKPRPEPPRWVALPIETSRYPLPPDPKQRTIHAVDRQAPTATLCDLDATDVDVLPLEPYSTAGPELRCAACAETLRATLRRHHHDDKVNLPCGWCHACGAYLGPDESAACRYCLASDVEG